MKHIALALFFAAGAAAQIFPSRASKFRVVPSTPATCDPGDVAFVIGDQAKVCNTTNTWTNLGASGGSGGGASAIATFATSATSGTLTHNFGSATHQPPFCVETVAGLPVIPSSITLGTNADTINFTGGLAAETKCYTTTGGGGGGASSAISTLYALGSSGSAKTVDPANGWAQTMTLSANCTVTLTQPSAGSHAVVRVGVTQAANGGPYTVTFTGAKWPGGIAPVQTATASGVDWYACLLDGTNSFCTAGQSFQ